MACHRPSRLADTTTAGVANARVRAARCDPRYRTWQPSLATLLACSIEARSADRRARATNICSGQPVHVVTRMAATTPHVLASQCYWKCDVEETCWVGSNADLYYSKNTWIAFPPRVDSTTTTSSASTSSSTSTTTTTSTSTSTTTSSTASFLTTTTTLPSSSSSTSATVSSSAADACTDKCTSHYRKRGSRFATVTAQPDDAYTSREDCEAAGYKWINRKGLCEMN